MERVRPWLMSDGQARDILKRRDKIVKRLEQEARKRGEAAVFPPETGHARAPCPCAIIDSDEGDWPVAQLIVRDLDPEIVVELRRRAAESGRSAEAEHRELLRSVLKPGRKRTPLKSLLLGMPAVGEDADFARGQSRARAVRL
jgi:plasmid stability protein